MLIPFYIQLSPSEYERLDSMNIGARLEAILTIWESPTTANVDIDKLADITYEKLSLKLGEDRAAAILRGTHDWDPEQTTPGLGVSLVEDVEQIALELDGVASGTSRIPDGIDTLAVYSDSASRGNAIVVMIT